MSDAISGAIGGIFNFAGSMFTNAQNARIAADQLRAQQVAQANAQEFSFAENERNRNLQVASQANAQTYNNDQANYARDWQVQQRLGAQEWQHYQREAAQDWTQGQREQVQAWESEMSNTAYQRGVADMRAAGLNPILGVKGGGASTPTVSPGSSHAGSSSGGSGASASSQGVSGSAGSIGGIQGSSYRAMNAIGEGINTGMALAKTLTELRNMETSMERTEAETDLAQARTQNVDANTVLARMEPDVIRQKLINMGLEAGRIKAMTDYQAAATYAAMGAGEASRASAGLSGAQQTQQEAVTDYFKQTSTLPGTSAPLTLGHGIATTIGKIGEGVADYAGQAWNYLRRNLPTGTSARGNENPRSGGNYVNPYGD